MKHILLFLLLIPSLVFSQSRKEKKAQAKADKITLANLKAHVGFLADDKLEGRRTGTQGELLAMDYIAKQFAAIGLTPKGTDNYVQEFVIQEGKHYDSTLVSLSINDASLRLKTDFYPLAYTAFNQLTASGSPSLREKDDIWFFDVADLLEENKNNPHFDIHAALKAEAAKDAAKGAKALLVYNSSAQVDNILFNKFDTSAQVAIPVLYLTKKAFTNYCKDATAIYSIQVKTALEKRERKARNVIGYIDNGAAATVIIGAHYDHLGYGEDANSLDGFGAIHNGADDNASGTAAMIEIARLLKQKSAKNNNYLFIAFSGEELGLMGSKHWLQQPTIPVNANYMINLDMVGRYDTAKKLTIGGYGTSPSWSKILTADILKDLKVKFDSSGSGPSDHASFYRKDIPVLFFFTNTHNDYHKASDDADKINYEGQVAIVNLVKNIIQQTGNEGKLAFLKTAEPKMGRATFTVSLGVMPDYGYSGTGMRIDGVSKGKLAEKIGLQAGDILLQLGEYKFVDVASYMQALGKFNQGDKTKLTILRNGKELQFEVNF